jgi:hypothetical protein
VLWTTGTLVEGGTIMYLELNLLAGAAVVNVRDYLVYRPDGCPLAPGACGSPPGRAPCILACPLAGAVNCKERKRRARA